MRACVLNSRTQFTTARLRPDRLLTAVLLQLLHFSREYQPVPHSHYDNHRHHLRRWTRPLPCRADDSCTSPPMSASEPPPLPPPHRRPLFTLFTLPLSLTKRIRLICFDLSSSLLVVGTASGSVYYYHRPNIHAAFASLAAQLSSAALLPLSSPFASRPYLLPPPTLLRLLTLGLPPASASITRVALCPHQPELLALTTPSSLLLLHCPPHNPQQRERLIHRLDSPHVAHLTWTTDDSKRPVLWSADSEGQLMRTVVVGNGGGVGLAQRVTTEVICKLDSAIVQLSSPRSSSASVSSSPPFLLVSTLTRSYIVTIPTASTLYKAQPIGSKPRKEPFTACLDPFSPLGAPHILASRPGKRIWRADMSGTVLSTLIIQPPNSVSSFAPCASSVGCDLPATFAVSAMQYSQLTAWSGGVVVWSAGSGWWLYMDVGHVCVADWMVGLGRVMDVRGDGSECWLMHDREEADGGVTAASLDDAVDISIVYSSSPYSHIQRFLSSSSSSTIPTPSTSPLSPLIQFATKHRIFDRQLLTSLQQKSQQHPLEPSLQQQFDALIVDAERAERLGRREDYWDDEITVQQQHVPDSHSSSATPTTGAAASTSGGGGGEVGGLAGVRSALSSAAQLVGKLAPPQLGGKDKAKEKAQEKEAAITNPASPKPSSFLERTSALFSSATAAVTPSQPAVTTITVITPAEHSSHAPTNGATTSSLPPTSRSASPALSMDTVAHHEAPHSGKPSPINPFLLSSSSASQLPKLTASSSFSSTMSSSSSSTSAPVSPTPVAAAPDVFARASLLPADNLPFAEAVEEARAVREEKKAEAATGKKRRVVDVGAAGEDERREREKRRREKREAERKKREKEEREKHRQVLMATTTAQPPPTADVNTAAVIAVDKHSEVLEVKEEQAVADLATVGEEKQLTSSSEETQRSAEDSYPSPSDTEEEGYEDETTQEESYVEAEGDDVTVMLHPSSTSLFAGMQTSPLASLLPCLQSMRWTLTAASIACREADVSFIIVENEDVEGLKRQRWQHAQLPLLPIRRETATTLDTDSGRVQQSVWSAVHDWLRELRDALLHCDALSVEATEDDNKTDAPVESKDDYEARIHRLQLLLSSLPSLLSQELAALVTMHFHLLLLSPQSEDVSSFLHQHRSLLDRLTVYSLLRHYRHPLCFELMDIFPSVASTELSEAEALPADPIMLAALLSSLLLLPTAALAVHLASSYPHIQPWMVIDRLDLASSLSSSAPHTTSPITLIAQLHSSLPPVTSPTSADMTSVAAVEVHLNFCRAYLDYLVHSPTSPSYLQRSRTLTEPFLHLSLRIGAPATPLTPRTATASLWPFSASLLSIAARPPLYGFGASELVDVLSSHGFWCGLPVLYVRLLLCAPSVSTFESALSLVVRMDDAQSLASVLAVLSSSALDLHTRLTYAQSALTVYVSELEQQQPLPVNISLSHLLHPLLLALGPPLLLQLLLSLPSASPVLARLPVSFHSHLLAHSHRLHTLSRQVTAVIDTVDSYLWSERPAALPPQLRRGGGGNPSARPLHVWAEDAGGVDWGRVIGGGGEDGKGGGGVSCGCCGVRIEWSERAGETVVCFACDGRHVYHRQCLPELACVLCLMTSMRAAIAESRLSEPAA